MRTVTLALLAALALVAHACEFHFDSSHRSGPVTDDYVGEPLTEDVKKYEHALDVCNEFVRKLKAREFEAIDSELCSEELHKLCGADGLESIDKSAVAQFGQMKLYKPLQWGFAASVRDGRKLLCSTKIVEYERGKVRFNFVFRDDGKYEKLLGVHLSEWKGPLPPGQQ